MMLKRVLDKNMVHKIKLTNKAKLEFKEAAVFYKKVHSKIARLFLSEINIKLKDIQSNPLHYRKIRKGLRQVPIKKFLYVIVYEITTDIIVVYSIFRTSRNPNKKQM